ncbi:DAZ-associated protein 2 [Meleagris gallopavo]|uniref:DAZ-associated protein 2 n=1 Tax=Meleagris gallopavo TaxID=9103 RepID=A0A803XN37_MELGA|nr:DAZ-associated protein 2 [Meleagris gallopavo]
MGVWGHKAWNNALPRDSVQLYRPSFVPLGAATVPTMSAAYPGASVFLPVAQSVAVGPIGSSVPMAYYPVGPVYPPGSTVLVEGGFDAGARFGAGGTASIPVSTD